MELNDLTIVIIRSDRFQFIFESIFPIEIKHKSKDADQTRFRLHLIGKHKVFFIMPQTGAYLDAIYKLILHLSKISAMCLIINYHSVLLLYIFDMLIKD